MLFRSPIAADPRERPFRPDPEAVRLAFRVGHAADARIGDRQAATGRILPNDIAHPDDREAEALRDGKDLLLPASGHARDAHDVHGTR